MFGLPPNPPRKGEKGTRSRLLFRRDLHRRRRGAELHQQFVLLALRLLEVPLLHIAVAADLFGDRGERHRQRMILRREAFKKFIDKRFVVGDELALGAPFLGTPEQVERRAAQESGDFAMRPKASSSTGRRSS